jgi:hypothetical protein
MLSSKAADLPGILHGFFPILSWLQVHLLTVRSQVEEVPGGLAQNVPPGSLVDERQRKQSFGKIKIPMGPIRRVHQLGVRLHCLQRRRALPDDSDL